MERFSLLGIHVDSISEEEVYERILSLSELDKPSQVILLDTKLLIKSKFNKNLKKVINESELVLPISAGIKSGLSFGGNKLEKLFNYFSFTRRLLAYFTEKNKTVYMLGGTPKSVSIAEKNVRETFPGMRLMGMYHTRYHKDFEPKLLTSIQKIGPSMIISSMKRPKQEFWIANHKNILSKGVVIGVEGFMDILGGKTGSPSDKWIHSKVGSFFKALLSPLRMFDYIIYITLLIVYKLFNIK